MAMLIYAGPSLLDGSPIAVLASFESRNSKTGGMTQTHIVRADMTPAAAIASGADISICGMCPHRIDKSCYVHPIIKRGNGTASTYRAFDAGNAEPFRIAPFVGRPLRLGTYGDPAAVPFEVWQPLLAVAAGHTGYTHQWRTCDTRYQTVCMASCDSETDVADATAAGWDTYYVHPVGTLRPAGMKPCPASAESGVKLTCASCLRCGGTSTGRRNNHVGILAHGAGAGKFAPAVTPATPPVDYDREVFARPAITATPGISLPLAVTGAA